MKNLYIVIRLCVLVSLVFNPKPIYSQTCTALSPPVVTGNTLAACVSSGSFTLTSNPSSTYTTAWYQFPYGGNAITSSSVLTTPVISTSATYYTSQFSPLVSSSVALPPHVSSYPNQVRGMWFVAPVSFVITGLRVPLDVGGTSNSAIAVLQFTAGPPTNFPTLTNAFNTLFLDQNIVGTGIVPVNIPVYAGDVIGILGQRGSNTSYGAGTPIASTIGTTALSLNRLGMQYNLATQTPTDVWNEAGGSLGRMEVYTDVGCLSSLVPVTVTVSNVPVITIASPTAGICANGSYTLNASGVSTYTWVNGPQTSSNVITPSGTTAYSVSGAINPTCMASAAITITVDTSPPIISVTSSTTQVCLGQTATLSATGAFSYTWSNNVTNGVSFTPAATNVYTVTGQNGCGIATATTAISVTPLQVNTIASHTLVCQGYPTTLTAVSAPASYTWQPGMFSNASVIVTPMANTIYTVTASDGTCAGTSTVEVVTKTTPTITTAAATSTICQGQSLNLVASGAGIGGTYTWSPGALTGSMVTVTPNTTTLYIVSATNSLNCEASANQVVIVAAASPIQVSANSYVVCSGGTVNLTASAANSYTWVGGPSTATYVVSPLATTVYTVLGGNTSNTCVASKTIEISAVVPNVIVSSDLSVCAGQSATLIASGANSYAWNGGPTLPIGTLIFTPLASGVQTVVANTQSFSIICPTTRTLMVTVNNNPTVTVTAARARVCRGETNTLTANGASTYSWSGASTSGSIVVISPITTTLLTISGIDANGCENTIQYQVLVSPCTSIAEEGRTIQSILVFPNPNNGSFTVKVENPIILELKNNLGQLVKILDMNAEDNFTVELNNLSSGIYFLVGENENGKVREKIVVSR